MTRTLRSRNFQWWFQAGTLAAFLGGSMIPLVAGGAPADPKIERTWKAKCASCHGADGKGDTDQGKKMGVADMSKADWQKKFTDAQIKDVTLNGIKREKDGKKQEMDPYKDKLKPEQIDGLVTYIRSLAK